VGIGVLALAGNTMDSPMLQPNGTRFDGWLLNTADNALKGVLRSRRPYRAMEQARRTVGSQRPVPMIARTWPESGGATWRPTRQDS